MKNLKALKCLVKTNKNSLLADTLALNQTTRVLKFILLSKIIALQIGWTELLNKFIG